jgi:hypothetical protein
VKGATVGALPAVRFSPYGSERARLRLPPRPRHRRLSALSSKSFAHGAGFRPSWGGKNSATSMLGVVGTASSMLRSSPTERVRSANAVVRDLYFGRRDRRIWVVRARTRWSACSKILRSATGCAPSNAFSGERPDAATSRDMRHIRADTAIRYRLKKCARGTTHST